MHGILLEVSDAVRGVSIGNSGDRSQNRYSELLTLIGF